MTWSEITTRSCIGQLVEDLISDPVLISYIDPERDLHSVCDVDLT